MQHFTSPPHLYRPDGTTAWMTDLYRGRPAFLICAGPSLIQMDLSVLDQPGILTCSVNNAGALFRTNLWVSVDHPDSFSEVIWRDPAITKFVPMSRMARTIRVRDPAGELVDSNETVASMPALYGIRLGGNFVPEDFLHEQCFTWGNESRNVDEDGNRGSRSVFLVALKLLYVLGVKDVYLLGCDFRMRYGTQNYAFAQERTRSSVRGNNRTYRILQTRLSHLLPYFESAGFRVLNCTPNSGLKVFPYVPYEQAISACLAPMPRKVNTLGMYDARPRTPAENAASSVKPG